MSELLKCPFCGGEVKILVCDDEGNIHDEEYENDPWSGLGYKLYHDEMLTNGRACPIARYEGEGEMGMYIYDTRAEAIDAWNTRADGKDTDVSTNDGWIPCSERLPEADQMVLVTEEDSPYVNMCCYEYAYGYGCGFHGSSGKVLAWMPLPEPYKGE